MEIDNCASRTAKSKTGKTDMGRRKKNKARRRHASVSKAGGRYQNQTGSPRRQSKLTRHAIWSICGIVVVAAAVAAWSVWKDESPEESTFASVEPLSVSVPADKSEPYASDPVPMAEVAAPRLIIPETEFDFGFVPQNAKVSHVFWLYSAGTDTLKIVKVNPG